MRKVKIYPQKAGIFLEKVGCKKLEIFPKKVLTLGRVWGKIKEVKGAQEKEKLKQP